MNTEKRALLDPSDSIITMARLSQAGVVPTSANAVMYEFQQHWNRPNNQAFATVYTDVGPNYRAVIESFQKAQKSHKRTRWTTSSTRDIRGSHACKL
jgi:hypothetical protein